MTSKWLRANKPMPLFSFSPIFDRNLLVLQLSNSPKIPSSWQKMFHNFIPLCSFQFINSARLCTVYNIFPLISFIMPFVTLAQTNGLDFYYSRPYFYFNNKPWVLASNKAFFTQMFKTTITPPFAIRTGIIEPTPKNPTRR